MHCWGEKAEGEWTLEIQDMPSQVRNPEKQGQWLWGPSALGVSALSLPLELSFCYSVSGHSFSIIFLKVKFT